VPPDPAFYAYVLRSVRPRSLAGVRVEVGAPMWVPLEIFLQVTRQDASVSRERLRQSLLAAFAPLFDRASASAVGFGQALYASSLLAIASQVPGVARATVTRFCPVGATGVQDRIQPTPLEILRVAND